MQIPNHVTWALISEHFQNQDWAETQITKCQDVEHNSMPAHHTTEWFNRQPYHAMPTTVRSPTAHKTNLRPYRSNPVEIPTILLLLSLSFTNTIPLSSLPQLHSQLLPSINSVLLKCSGVFNRKERSKEECKGVGVVGGHESVVLSSQANCHLLRHWHGFSHLSRHLHHCHHCRLQIHRV